MSQAVVEAPQKNEAIEKAPAPASARFLAHVEQQFAAQMGRGVELSEFEQRLVQNMYVHVDRSLKDAEARRKESMEPINWNTIDRAGLAIATVHVVRLGLDPNIDNFVHAIPRWNKHNKLYDVNLQLGYAGEDYIARRDALDPPLDIIYELVYDTDHFKALPRSSSRQVEGYEFEIEKPFNRGKIIGGFGYIMHEQPEKNQLVLVTQRDFNRAKEAGNRGMWADNDVEMHWKTIVHRVFKHIRLDPKRVNSTALAALLPTEESSTERAAVEVQADANRSANQEVLELPSNSPAPAAVRTIDMEPDPQPANGSVEEFPEEPDF